MSIKLIKCPKCGSMVISHQVFLQQFIDEIEECNRKAHQAGSMEKGVYIKQAAGYTAMLKGFMHNLTTADLADQKESEYILRDLCDYVYDRKLISKEELTRIYEQGRSKCKAKKAEATKEMSRIFGEFETACNRTKASPTERKALRNMSLRP